jgi:phosphoglycolate phosphatase-like HAD superfamily hydrolase
MKWQAVFWDFDGVVLDSVNVKTKAFSLMFSQYGPDVEKAVVEYHLANGGISRFEKFVYFYNHLLNRSVSEEELTVLGEQFSSLVVQEVIAAPFIPGARESLDWFKSKGIPCFVVSGTPQEEIVHIVTKRGLDCYFVEVHGSPRGKPEIVHDIIERFNYTPQCCLLIGDAMTDFEAAMANAVQFIGVVPFEGSDIFPAGTITSPFIGKDLIE